jgi:hypothetical protein
MASSKENLQIFENWVLGKTAQDFGGMIHRGTLNRETITIECGFSKSVLRQNPKIKALLKELEDRLRSEGVLRSALPPKTPSTASCIDQLESEDSCTPHPAPHLHRDGPAMTEGALHQRRGPPNLEPTVRRLQSENASQRAEIQELRRQLGKLAALQEALSTSGRLPR